MATPTPALSNTSEFLKYFDFVSNPSYLSVKSLKDVNVGFSVLRHYSSEGRFRPALDKSDSPDTIVLIKVIYRDEKRGEDDRVPVSVRYMSTALRHCQLEFSESVGCFC